jgi:hypothetical protein
VVELTSALGRTVGSERRTVKLNQLTWWNINWAVHEEAIRVQLTSFKDHSSV